MGNPPQDTTLIEYAQGQNPADVEWIEVVQEQLGDMMYLGLAQKHVAAGDVPEVWVVGHYSHYGDAMSYLSDTEFAHEMTPQFIKENLPIYTERVEDYGLTVETIQQACDFEGKNWYLNWQMSPGVFPGLLKTEYGQLLGPHQFIYHVYLRDDILKQLRPNARTEAEMKELYLEQDGELSLDDVLNDLPFNDFQSLTRYMQEVKALNKRVGTKPVIPAAFNCSSGNIGSVHWSAFTVTGWTHRYPLLYQEPPKRCFYPRTTETWKEYMNNFNLWYNEGYLDPELFVMKDDQYHAKVRNGEYAIINAWTPVADARQVSIDENRGYGWRYAPIFYPVDFSMMNQWFSFAGIKSLSTLFTKSIDPEDLPGILAWADWQFSEEADELQYWGHPDWYTGEGMNRRYKPAYEDLRLWTVYGISGEKDGDYYGMRAPVNVVQNKPINNQSRLRCMDFTSGFGYQYSPTFVYDHDPADMGEITDMGPICAAVVDADMMAHQRVFLTTEWEEQDYYMMFEDVSSCINTKDYTGTYAKLLTDERANFERNWKAWMDMWSECGVPEAEKKVADQFLKDWPTKIKPNEVK
jgi:ABC-type glycerol-3-phosphate transport system substrate-binding protein